MSPVARASSVPGLRAALQAAAPSPAADPEDSLDSFPEAAPSPPPRRERPPARAPKPIRFTVDLTPELHRFLKRLALDTGADAALIVRALLREARTDKDLARRIQTAVWAAQAQAQRRLL